MRFKTAISLPLLICAVFLFRMYGMSFFIPKASVNESHRTILLKRSKNDGIERGKPATDFKCFLNAKHVKKYKAVRCKKFRMQAPDAAPAAFIFTTAFMASAPVHAPPSGVKCVALRRYLSISILRI